MTTGQRWETPSFRSIEGQSISPMRTPLDVGGTDVATCSLPLIAVYRCRGGGCGRVSRALGIVQRDLISNGPLARLPRALQRDRASAFPCVYRCDGLPTVGGAQRPGFLASAASARNDEAGVLLSSGAAEETVCPRNDEPTALRTPEDRRGACGAL